jgi:hypothetical protein
LAGGNPCRLHSWNSQHSPHLTRNDITIRVLNPLCKVCHDGPLMFRLCLAETANKGESAQYRFFLRNVILIAPFPFCDTTQYRINAQP